MALARRLVMANPPRSMISREAFAKKLGGAPEPTWWDFVESVGKRVVIGERTKELPAWKRAKASGAPAAGTLDWADGVTELYDANAVARLLHEADDGDLGFWHASLCAYAYPVAETASGDPIVIVTSGRSAGHVLLTNHEAYHGGFEHLADWVAGKKLPKDFAADVDAALGEGKRVPGKPPTADQIVRVLVHEDLDGGRRLARSFAEFYGGLGKAVAARGKPAKPTKPAAKGAPAISTTPVPDATAVGSSGDAVIIGRGAVYRTTDGAKLESLDVSVRKANGIVADGGLLLICGFDRLMRSADGGQTFTQVKLQGQLAGVARHHDGSIWVASEGRATTPYFARSTDGGKTFTKHDAGIRGLPRLFGSTSRGVLGAVYDNLVFLGGTKVEARQALAYERIDAAIETASGALVIAAGGFARSTDGGATWKKSTGAKPADCYCLAPLSSGAIIAGDDRNLYLSTDDGASFVLLQRAKGGAKAATRHGSRTVLAGEELLFWIA